MLLSRNAHPPCMPSLRELELTSSTTYQTIKQLLRGKEELNGSYNHPFPVQFLDVNSATPMPICESTPKIIICVKMSKNKKYHLKTKSSSTLPPERPDKINNGTQHPTNVASVNETYNTPGTVTAISPPGKGNTVQPKSLLITKSVFVDTALRRYNVCEQINSPITLKTPSCST